MDRDFRYLIKQHGGMFAKGRLLGIQFEALFTDGLYESLGKHAVDQAQRLRAGIAALRFPFLTASPTNQIFPIFPKAMLTAIAASFVYSPWCAVDETHEAIRLCASWATDPAQVDALLELIRRNA